MSDTFSKEKRSAIMASIRSKNTMAEMITFAYLRKHGIYFQKHYTRVPGKPDIALPRRKLAVFIDGDFWHGRTIERLIERDVDNKEYWVPKILRNIERDQENNQYLRDNGWQILRVWDSDIKRMSTRGKVLLEVKMFLES